MDEQKRPTECFKNISHFFLKVLSSLVPMKRYGDGAIVTKAYALYSYLLLSRMTFTIILALTSHFILVGGSPTLMNVEANIFVVNKTKESWCSLPLWKEFLMPDTKQKSWACNRQQTFPSMDKLPTSNRGLDLAYLNTTRPVGWRWSSSQSNKEKSPKVQKLSISCTDSTWRPPTRL